MKTALRWLGWIAFLGVLAVIAGTLFFHNSAGDMFMPHEHCYLFNKRLMMLHGWSDLVIGLSYVAISLTLTYLVFRLRRDLPFHSMMLAFATFIVACGITHFMEVWTLVDEHPRYWLAGELKLLTAIASLATALLLPPLVPKVRLLVRSAGLAIGRKDALEKAYGELNDIYNKALAFASDDEIQQNGQAVSPADADPSDLPNDLALMARKVTLHAQELERARQEAENANRAKDEFLAVLSHELRAPLMPALATASYLETNLETTPEELRDSLSMIRRNIELEARLVDDLLDITRITKGKLEIHHSTVDLNQSIQQAVDMCSSAAQSKGIELLVRLGATEKYVRGDGARLAQVFWNVLLNAVKFTPAGGRITVLSSNPAPGAIRVDIIDTGIGIEPEWLVKIFEPFEQGKALLARRLGGVGLGLSIAKALVETHDGSISAQSDGKDKGTTFSVTLPTVLAPAAAKPAGDAQTAADVPRALRILVVEDHGDARTVLVRVLKKWGHVVESAATMNEGLEAAARFNPELLVTDIGLPDGTGTDLLARLKTTSNLAAIAMSGYGMEIDIKQSKLAGFSAHLTKPVSMERLQETIAQIFRSETDPTPG